MEEFTCRKCKREIPNDSVFCPYCGKQINPTKKRPRRPNGAGSVCKVSGKRKRPWLARVQKGDMRYTVGYYQTEAEAMKAVALFDPDEERKEKARKKVTLKEVFDILIARKKGKIKSETLDSQKKYFEKLKPLWDKDVSLLKPDDYQKALCDLSPYLSTGTIKLVRSLIHEIGKWCVANEYTRFNPADYLETVKGKDKKVTKNTFNEDEIKRIWEDDSEDAHIILCLIYTGLRIEELFTLKHTDIHLDEDGYNYLVGGEKTDAGKERVVMIHPRILPFFQDWMSNDSEYLITNGWGKKTASDTWRRFHYYPLLEKLQITKIPPHKARHTFATRIAAKGGNITALQKTIGHANYSTTANIYTHPEFEELKKLVELQT